VILTLAYGIITWMIKLQSHTMKSLKALQTH